MNVEDNFQTNINRNQQFIFLKEDRNMTEMDQKDSDSDQSKAEVSPELLKQLRELVWTYQSVGQLDTAIYWADKLVSLGDADIAEDVYSLGQCLVAARQFHRAAHTVMRAHLHLGYCGLRAARGAGDGRGARHHRARD